MSDTSTDSTSTTTTTTTTETRKLTGRRVIYSSVPEITRANVLDVIAKASAIHNVNAADIRYLWKYFKGDQPVLSRTKEVRSEICNNIVENFAWQIGTFKTDYVFGEPIQYSSRKGDAGGEQVARGIALLNDMMWSEGKYAHDRDIGESQAVCGTAYRMVLPDRTMDPDDEAPFSIYTLSAETTYLIYSTDYTHRPLGGVTYCIDEDLQVTTDVYTPKRHFRFIEGSTDMVVDEPHALGRIPIIEYPANNARLGAFEVVIPLLDAINIIQSNRVDGVEQFVQSYMEFVNCDIDADLFEKMKKEGAIVYRSTADAPARVDVISQELNQQQTQTLVDSMYDEVLRICGMPRHSGNGSTSDTGAAVIMRDGWQDAEARAKDTEWMFKRSEQEFLKLVLHICRTTLTGFNLKFSDIDMTFTRRNYEAIQSKSQVLISMLQCPGIHPLLAYQYCGMFIDPQRAYQMSQEYQEEEDEKNQQKALEIAGVQQLQQGQQTDTEQGDDGAQTDDPEEGDEV